MSIEFLTSLAALIAAIASLIGAIIAGMKIRIEWIKFRVNLEDRKSQAKTIEIRNLIILWLFMNSLQNNQGEEENNK